ncbi:hypothetical protein D9V41_08730 [Aeromicrobium phragmitis]|uniref:Large ATP-binding protein n=1 Tax=Aeromicrobium phragmitis TaxID=2478914 RepID=A0A3L8PPM7_9ACTN|nr:hypothetical protein [Aeromicrobium phragmitis]RLV55972.1 hypothetical protein D9V41_08730 [Aeromicrobium phragmitis]
MSVLSEAVAAELERVAQRAAQRAARAAESSAARAEEQAEADGAGGEAGPQDAVAVDGEVRVMLSSEDVEDILSANGIPTSASPATPVPLRVTRIHFSGVKVLPADHPLAAGHELIELAGPDVDGGDVTTDKLDLALAADANDSETPQHAEPIEASIRLAAVPIDWSWEPQLGVNGVGSGRNLRGKSTVLNVLMWALSGRCANFQVDTKAWLKHIEVDWQVGGETIRVKFDNDRGHPVGVVETVDKSNGTDRVRAVGAFDGEDQFEDVMGTVMMSRLRLEEIPMWTGDREVRHKWPAYASAFTVRADMLDPVVGNVTVLGTRMLQMFVGTDWGPALAATQTALNEVRAQQTVVEQKVSAAGEVVRQQREKAQAEVDRLEAAVKAIPASTPDVEQLIAATANATELARQVHELERKVMDASSHVDTVRLQLRAAKARNHTKFEDALAVKFFHQMTPSVCPRCTSKVTPEQQAAETEKHECSLCSKELRLEEVDTSKATVAAGPVVGDVDAPVDDLEALETALTQAERVVDALNSQITAKKDQLAAAETQSTSGKEQLAAAEDRRRMELELARAEGALAAFKGSSDPEFLDPADPAVVAVLEAAKKVLSNWMSEGQNPLLERISADIEKLAVGFGADSLSRVKLGGGGRLDVVKGGGQTTYTRLTAGEKLRVKIATAVALIKHGYVAQIGRHPGFLVLDSPAAEEMPEEDLAILMAELVEVAEQAEMQIFVGTRNAGPLLDLLPEASRRVAVGDDYLW